MQKVHFGGGNTGKGGKIGLRGDGGGRSVVKVTDKWTNDSSPGLGWKKAVEMRGDDVIPEGVRDHDRPDAARGAECDAPNHTQKT